MDRQNDAVLKTPEVKPKFRGSGKAGGRENGQKRKDGCFYNPR